MSRIKNKICRAVISAAWVMAYLIVGGMEHFRIGLGEGTAAVVGCFGAMFIAWAVGCREV